MDFKLIGDLYESRMFPSKTSMKKLNAEDVAEMAFLYLIALQILKSEFSTEKFAQDYLYKTFKFGNFDRISSNSTDLAWLLHVLSTRNAELLDGNRNNETELGKINLNDNVILNWARQAIKGRTSVEVDRRFFIMLEKMLNIRTSNYRSVRTLASEWQNLDVENRQLAMTRLLMAFRKKMLRAEVYQELDHLADKEDLEIHGAANPEEGHDTSHSSVLSKIIKGGLIAGALALPIISNIKDYKAHKAYLATLDSRHMRENAAVGGTSAGAIASVVQPMAMVRRVKTGTRKKKGTK